MRRRGAVRVQEVRAEVRISNTQRLVCQCAPVAQHALAGAKELGDASAHEGGEARECGGLGAHAQQHERERRHALVIAVGEAKSEAGRQARGFRGRYGECPAGMTEARRGYTGRRGVLFVILAPGVVV